MAYQVVWTPEGRKTFFDIIEYIATDFTEREITKFVQKVDDKIGLIITNPNIYRRSTKIRNVHFTNIFRKVLLIYQVMPRKKQILLLKFWDGRQDPKKFKH